MRPRPTVNCQCVEGEILPQSVLQRDDKPNFLNARDSEGRRPRVSVRSAEDGRHAI